MRFILARIQFLLPSRFISFFLRSPSASPAIWWCWRDVAAHQNDVSLPVYHFWLKMFAVNFGMGVVSGTWSWRTSLAPTGAGFSQFAGSITGPPLTYGVLTAFLP